MSKKRVFRILVCTLVICSLLINCSPIRAEALVAEAAVTGAGVFATLFAMAMGVVFVDLTAQLINGMGRSLENHLSSTTTEEEAEILKVWIEPLKVDFDGGISQDPEPPDDNGMGALGGLFSLPKELLDNLLSWGSSLINGEGVEVEDSENMAPEGYAFYNGFLFPDINIYPSVYDHACIINVTNASELYGKMKGTYLFVSKSPFIQSSDGWFQVAAGTYYYARYYSDVWNEVSSSTLGRAYGGTILWANHDVMLYEGGLYMSATEPSRIYTLPVYPNIYVGDIPQQVKDGTFEEEKYELPYINYNQIFQGQTDTVAALNNVATQLQNQTMTYEQYMEQIRTEVDTNTGTDSGTTTDPWSPPADPGAFALDLTNYFPFCIPFDLYDFLSCLAAEPEAPVISWELPIPGGSTFPIELDLSPFDPVAQLLRRLELLLFIVGLAIKTRDLIKG